MVPRYELYTADYFKKSGGGPEQRNSVSGAEGYQEELTLYVGVPRVYRHTTASYMRRAYY